MIYVYLMVPELSGLSVEEIDDLFTGPWFNAYKRSKKARVIVSEEPGDLEGLSYVFPPFAFLRASEVLCTNMHSLGVRLAKVWLR